MSNYLSKGPFANDSQEVKVSGPGTKTRAQYIKYFLMTKLHYSFRRA